MVYTKEGKLGAVVGAGSSLKLTTAIKSIGENAFALSSDLDTLVIPKEMTILTLDKDCFAGSNIKRVLCSTQTQVDMLSKQLADSGAPEDLLLSLLTTTKDGYEYYTEVNANGEIRTHCSPYRPTSRALTVSSRPMTAPKSSSRPSAPPLFRN